MAELNAMYCLSKAYEETSVLPGLVGLWEWSLGRVTLAVALAGMGDCSCTVFAKG